MLLPMSRLNERWVLILFSGTKTVRDRNCITRRATLPPPAIEPLAGFHGQHRQKPSHRPWRHCFQQEFRHNKKVL
jgi:hypothetical protein